MAPEEVVNFLRVSTLIASSGQPAPHQFREISRVGYRGIINLAMPDSQNALAQEGSIVTSLGMTYIHLPVPFDAPKAEHLRRFSGFMELFSLEKIWVHCVLNYRASAFLFLHLSRLRAKAEAVPGPDSGPHPVLPDPQQALLPGWKPDAVWTCFMEEFSRGEW